MLLHSASAGIARRNVFQDSARVTARGMPNARHGENRLFNDLRKVSIEIGIYIGAADLNLHRRGSSRLMDQPLPLFTGVGMPRHWLGAGAHTFNSCDFICYPLMFLLRTLFLSQMVENHRCLHQSLITTLDGIVFAPSSRTTLLALAKAIVCVQWGTPYQATPLVAHLIIYKLIFGSDCDEYSKVCV